MQRQRTCATDSLTAVEMFATMFKISTIAAIVAVEFVISASSSRTTALSASTNLGTSSSTKS